MVSRGGEKLRGAGRRREGGGQGAPSPSGGWTVAEEAGPEPGGSQGRVVTGESAQREAVVLGRLAWSASASVFHKLRELNT